MTTPRHTHPMTPSTLAAAVSPVAYSLPPLDWKSELAQSLKSPADLAAYVQVPLASLPVAGESLKQFPLFAPRPYLDRVVKGDPSDPLLLQIWPHKDEDVAVRGFSQDPLGESEAAKSPGVLQKYAGRALLVVTGACAIHCRYCFRRHFPYQETPRGLPAWRLALETLRGDSSVQEVLLSGGDPLTLVDESLAEWFSLLEEMPHLKRLRIHTRLPVVIPQRVTQHLLKLLKETRLDTVMVLHINHPAEIDGGVEQAISSLRDSGALLLNQAVLLKGVNDHVKTLAELCQRLVELRVMPYYLNQLDRVQGAAHFEVEESKGLQIMEQLRAILPGYAMPRYVKEIPGAASKMEVRAAPAR